MGRTQGVYFTIDVWVLFRFGEIINEAINTLRISLGVHIHAVLLDRYQEWDHRVIDRLE